MKTINSKIIGLALVGILASGCTDFLTVEQKGKATIPAFLSDPRGLQAGLTGAYNTLFEYYDNEFMKYPEVAGNMTSMNLSSGSAMLDQYNFTPNPGNGTTSYYIWNRIGVALANANNIIQYEPVVEQAYPTQTEALKKVLGQALLLRALCLFDLTRAYAYPYNYTQDASQLGVPVLIKTPGPDDNAARNTVKEVYTQVLKDLDQAAGLLQDKVATDPHYGSLQAVNAMLSRVYLYMEDWNNALEYARQAIGSQQLADAEAYINMYKDLNKQGEMIFRLSGYKVVGHLKTFYESECLPADTLVNSYDPEDIRLQLLRQGTLNHCVKYAAEIIPEGDVKREDIPIFRLSEMFLNAAEAAFNLQKYTEARQYIAPILNRAIGKEKGELKLNSYTDADLITLIRAERVKELCFEGHNFFDLTRWKMPVTREWNTNSTMRQVPYPSPLLTLPIPQYELDANENMLPNDNNN